MNIRKFATISLLVLSSFAANNVAPSNAELESMYDRAFKQFNSNNYAEALKELDGIDARQPDLAQSQNLRGVIYMRQGNYDEAEKALQKALATDPKFWNARFNLAEIPFLKKNWTEARNRFQGLLFGNDLQLQGEALQLIQYKVLLTYLLEGKDNMVDSILAKLELAPDTPAVHYANAAIAFQRKNDKEAKDWLEKAEKNFTPQLNKLFAESIYEVGWMEKPAGQTRSSVELTSAADRAAKAKAFARSKFDQAEQAFQQRDFTAARKAVDEADAADPNQPPYLNFRGEILLAQKDFDGAEAAFKQALKIDSKFREAQYNLAQIPFKKKEYTKARERFEALFSATPAPGGDKNQAGQLIKFKIYLTLLLEGKDSVAQKMMEQFQFTGDTPALYYARAAWEFKHNNAAKGNDWVTSARKIYSPAMNMVFSDAFYDLGWLQNAATAPAQASAELAKVESTPSVEPTAIPGAALASNAAKQPAQNAPQKSADKPVAGMEATTERSPVAATASADKAAAAPAAASPSVETPVAANASPAESRAPATAQTEQPAASQPPIVAANQNHPAASAAPSAAAPAESAPQIASTSVSATPATVLAPAKVQEWSRPASGESFDRFFDPHALLVGGLLLAGIIILAWVVIPEVRRRITRAPAYRITAPVSTPKFGPAARANLDERMATRAALVGGPRQISLQLKATEPSVRRSAVPFSTSNRPFGASVGAASGVVTSRSEKDLSPQPQPIVNGEATAVTEPPETIADIVTARAPDIAPEPATPASDEIEAPSSFANNGFVDEQVDAPEPPVVEAPVAFAEPPPIATEEIPAPAASDQPEIAPVDVLAEESSAAVATPDAEAESITAVEAPAEPEAFSAVSAEPPPAASVLQAPEAVAEPAAVESLEPEPVSAISEAPGVPEAAQAVAEPEADVEPIGQGQPIPQLIPATSGDGEVDAPSRVEPQPQRSRFAKLVAAGAALAGVGALRRAAQPQQAEPQPAQPLEPQPQAAQPAETQPQAEPEALAPAAVPDEPTVSEPIIQQTTPTEIMPPPTQPTPAPTIRTAPQAPMTGGAPQAQPQAGGGMHTAVQLTFSFEIAALQLTPTFKMGALQLRPTSRIVSMRLAPSQQPQPAMNLQVSFEIANVQLTGGAIGTVRLTPSQQQRPNVAGSPAFNIAGLQLLSGSENAAVQLTPAGHGQAGVQVTGRFQIATVEFSPSFEIAALVLNSTSRQVSVQLPGATQVSLEGVPVFDIGNVQLAANGEIGVMQLNAPGGSAAPRPA